MRTTLERLRARKGDEEGFTLIELLIVIIILAILATIVIFAVGTTTKNAAVAACKSTVKTVETAIEAYKAQGIGTTTGTYPASITVLVTTKTKGPWLKQVPTATVTTNGYQLTFAATTNNPTGATPATQTHGYDVYTGHFYVLTKTAGTPGLPDTSATICAGA